MRRGRDRTHLLTELCILIKAQLGIHAEDISALDLCERVDLNLGRVLVLEELVELDEDVGGLGLVGQLESELLGRGEGELERESLVKVDGDGDDGGRIITSNVLNAKEGKGGLVASDWMYGASVD